MSYRRGAVEEIARLVNQARCAMSERADDWGEWRGMETCPDWPNAGSVQFKFEIDGELWISFSRVHVGEAGNMSPTAWRERKNSDTVA